MKRRLHTIATLIILGTITSIAQSVWTLEECIRYAWENNLQIKQQELLVEQSKNTLQQSKYNYIPSLSASASHSMNWGRSVNLNDLQIIENKLSMSTSAGVSASIRLIDGMSKPNTVKSNQASLDISLLNVERLKNDISISITRSFLQIMLSKELLNTTKENYESVKEQKDRTKKLVDAGSQAYSALLDIEAQLSNERVKVVEAENQVKTNLLTLMQLLDLTYDLNFDILSPEIDDIKNSHYGENVDNLFEQSLDLPQIKGAELSLKREELQLAIAKGRAYPSLSLNAGYNTFYSNNGKDPFFQQFDNNRNPSIGLSLSVPIFSNLQIRTNIKNAALSVKSSEIDLRTKQQDLFKEIQSAVTDAEAQFQRYIAAGQNLKAMEESFRYVEQKFSIGTLTSTDYTVAKNNLSSAQSSYYQAKYQYIFSLKIIEFYKGIPITL